MSRHCAPDAGDRATPCNIETNWLVNVSHADRLVLDDVQTLVEVAL